MKIAHSFFTQLIANTKKLNLYIPVLEIINKNGKTKYLRTTTKYNKLQK